MATLTSGSKATTTMTALQSGGPTGAFPADADVASIAAAIMNDQAGAPSVIWPGAWSRQGELFIPNRGSLIVYPDDWVMVGPEGFPYLVPAVACAKTLTASGTPVSGTKPMVMGQSVIPLGWKIGGILAGTGIATNAQITNISADGLTVTMSANATSSPGSTTITYGSWTHS